MQKRGFTQRHTVGCTDDLSVTHGPGPGSQSQAPTTSSNMRQRRTGLLTVTERPPGAFKWLPRKLKMNPYTFLKYPEQV